MRLDLHVLKNSAPAGRRMDCSNAGHTEIPSEATAFIQARANAGLEQEGLVEIRRTDRFEYHLRRWSVWTWRLDGTAGERGGGGVERGRK